MMSDINATPVKKNELTAREMEILAISWQCMKSDPEVSSNICYLHPECLEGLHVT
jgi:hypothetical protein